MPEIMGFYLSSFLASKKKKKKKKVVQVLTSCKLGGVGLKGTSHLLILS